MVGGGPAGTAAAITASRSSGARVLLLESGKYPRQKVCGEFVSAEALDVLRELLPEGRGTLIEQAPRITHACFYSGAGSATMAVSPPAASIPRHELDAALWHAAEQAGVECHQQAVVDGVTRCGTTFRVKTAERTWMARSVVNSSGRWSRLSTARIVPPADTWVGLKAHYSVQTTLPKAPHTLLQQSTSLYFFEGGYCGVQPVGDGVLNVCAMVRAKVATSLEQVFSRHPHLQARSRNWKPCSHPVATAPLFFAPAQMEHDGVLYAGDAAAFIDPVSGDGISMALRTGSLAGKVFSQFYKGELTLEGMAQVYCSEYRRRFSPAFRMASRIRAIIDGPEIVRRMGIQLMRFPYVSKFLFESTR